MTHAQTFLIVLLAAVGCGSAQTPDTTIPPGDSRAAADDLDVAENAEGEAGLKPAEDGSDTGEAGEGGVAAAPAAPVVFRLKNSADEDLVFSLDKGWQPVIFAYSGKPPKAKSILMFPTFCTASCDVDGAERCPVCPLPEKAKEIKAAEKRETVPPGEKLDVPWDGQIHVYQKTRDAKGKKCECFAKEPVPEETYTVRACGLRLTKSAKESSKYQCVQGQMQFPADGPQVVELDFPAP